ncbi:hypothetical protein N7448_008967 [Penicillium atrosanguineum]|nr:hypothetical protein N7448_008967 [Penicillium atrosanguineum]
MNKELNIIQYNTHRSKDVMMAQFMRDPTVLQAGVIAIQEPGANPYQETTHHPAKKSHQLLYPQANETGGLRTRVFNSTGKRTEGKGYVPDRGGLQSPPPAKRHSAKFAPDKFELIHFSNPRLPTEPAPPLTPPRALRDIYEYFVEEGNDQMPLKLPDQGQTITPSSYAIYLGVWLDKYLNFSTHRDKVIAKANSSLEAFRGITGSTWGTSLSAMRQIYRAVVIPQLFWGVAAWWSPASRNIPAAEQSRMVRGFTRIQKRAALMISGAFKSTSAAALDIELFLTPINLLMQQTIEETAIRIQTGVPWALPEGLTAKRTTKRTRLGGITPLEAMKWKKNGPLAPLKGRDIQWESRTAFVLPPVGDTIELDAALADGAIQRIFTDGSGYAGLVGASAVNPMSTDWMQRHLGSLDQSNVYVAEFTGIEMALGQLVTRPTKEDKVRELVIFSGSQAAIKSLQNPKRPSGQYVLKSIYNHVRAIRSRGAPISLSITLRWIPAHVDVLGNELADEAAKSAALWGAGAEKHFVRLASAAKRCVRQRIKERWKRQWEREKTAKPTERLIKAPSRKALEVYEGLSKPDSQTPRHILLQCPLYNDLRRTMLDKIARTDLGDTTDYDAIVSHPRAARYAAAMMPQTGLLSQFRHVEAEPDTDDDDDHEQIGLAAMG